MTNLNNEGRELDLKDLDGVSGGITGQSVQGSGKSKDRAPEWGDRYRWRLSASRRKPVRLTGGVPRK